MRKYLLESFFILFFSLVISLIYSATSTTGIILLKKAFKIKAEAGAVILVSVHEINRKL